jgi:hypothetical protein
MNVEFLLGKAFSNFKNDKVQEYDIWMLKIPALQLKKWGEIGNGSPSVSIFRLLWHLGSFCRLIQQTLFKTADDQGLKLLVTQLSEKGSDSIVVVMA